MADEDEFALEPETGKPARAPNAEREALLAARRAKGPSEIAPNAILTAAQADIRRRMRNSKIHRRGYYERYAFLAAHVRKAKDASALLVLAIEKNDAARGTAKANTARIYRDLDTLRAALALTQVPT